MFINKTNIMYTKEKVKACSRWLTVLLMLLLCQATLAQEKGKETPTVTLSKNSYMVTVGEKDFVVPTITITNTKRNNITSRFSRTYKIEDGKQLTDEQGNLTKPVTWQDATTGTTVLERYGNVTIGGKTGTVKVNIAFTPIGVYADKYNNLSTSYTIQVNAPENITPTLTHNGNTIADGATLNISTGKNQWGNAQSGFTALPELKLTYKQNYDTYDITEYYDIYYTLGDTKGGVFSLDMTNKKLISTATTDAETTLTLTAKPKDDYTSVYGDKSYTFTFPVKSSFISTDKKLKTYISFKKHVQEVYKAPGTFNYYIPVITDEHGNDITSLYKSNNTWNVSTQWNTGDLTYTVDFKNIYKVSKNPYDQATRFAERTVDYSSADNPGQITFYGDGHAQLWSGAEYVRPDDYIITVTAKAPTGYENIYDDPVVKDETTTTVTMTPYQGQPESFSRSYDLKANQYVLNVMKNAPQIAFSPDPSKVKLAEKMEMTSGSRFDVKGYFPNVQAPTDSCLYEKNDFWYTYFVPDDLAWDSKKGDSQLTAETPVKVEVTGSVTKDKRREDNATESIKQANGSYKTMTGTRYWTQKQWGNENWKITFHGTGQIPLYYTIRPWNIMKWDVSSAQAVIYDIAPQEPVTLVIDPNSFVIHIGETAEAPSVKVYDQFGADLTEHYDFTYNVDNTAIATVDATDHHATGVAQGTATVTVTATGKADWKQKEYYKDVNSASYQIKVVPVDDSPAQYEVIYDDVPTSDSHTNRMGKLHFIKAGKFAAGQMAYQKVPGINITFGNPNEHHMKVVQSTADVSTGGQGLDNNNEDHDGTGESATYYKDVLFSNGHPTNNAGVELTGYDHDPIPVHGFFLKIEAITNGFLTIDARFNADKTVVLVRESDKRIERFHYDTQFIGEQDFHYALMAGQTYYLYSDDDEMRLHGLSFEPAFVLMPEDTDPYTAAQAFVNGYTGKLPFLRKTAYPTVEWQELENEKTSNRDINKDVATIDKGTGNLTIIGSTADKDQSGKSIDNRVKVWAKVLGEKKSDGKQVVKQPQYLLRISDIPIYMLTDDEDKPQVIPQPGQRVSTTNILTRMWMTYGGWEHQSEDYPYFKNNDKDAYPDLMYDGWKPAKMDSVGSNNRTINGFKVASFGEQNPTAENVRSWSLNDKNTFALPVRGAYVKFEPEESGTLIVYVLQNGLTDAQEQDTKLGDKYMLRRRAMYILDEAGHSVHLTKDDEWAGMSELSDLASTAGTSSTTPDKEQLGYYTESVFRCTWNKLLNAAGNDENKMFKHSTWSSLSEENKKTEMSAIETAWKDATVTIGTNNRLLSGTRQRVIMLSDSSYALPTKGYVRYSLHVKSGKTYYFFMTGSKLGLCGYAFVPEGFTGSFTEWTGKGKPTTENGETNEADEANRKNLPEPDNEKVYSTKAQTSPGYKNLNMYDSSSKGTNPTMTGKDGKYEFVNVTVNRSFQNGKWTGICLPFSVNETQVKEVFGQHAMVISFDGLIPEGEKKGWAHFSQHVNQLIEAGRPYFIKPAWTDETPKSSVTFNHVSLEGVEPMTLDCVYNPNNLTKDQLKVFQYQFIGNYTKTQVPAYSYVMSANAKDADGNVYKEGGLVRYAPKDATRKLSMAGFRSYLKPCKDEDGNEITTPEQAKMALIQGFEFDGTATGIDEIVEDMNVDLSRYAKGVYNLNGQLVSEKNSTEGLPAGVYIMNGKKIIVK